MVLTYFNILRIANAAHVAGLLFGICAAGAFVTRWKISITLPALTLMLAFPFVILFWCPWCAEWLAVQADRAYTKADYHKAIPLYSKVLEQHPDNPLTHFYRGICYDLTNQEEKAIVDYEASLRLFPALEGASNMLAWILATSPNDSLRNGKRAVELATTACELTNWKNPANLDTLAAAYAETGDFDQAVKWQLEAQKYVIKPEHEAEFDEHLKLNQEKKPYRDLKSN